MDRPSINNYETPRDFVRDMIRFRKATESGFSVHRSVRPLRKISPALVSLVVSGRRALTLDRVDEFAKLLNLNVPEKIYFRRWVGRLEGLDFAESMPSQPRKEVGVGLLSDWLNVYVKDFFQLKAVQKDPSLIERQLLAVAPGKRVAKAIQFLLREGYLRKDMRGQTVLESRLATAEPAMPSHKIRQFHKGALALAKAALDLYPVNERLANTLIIPLNEQSYSELQELIQEFAEKLKDFADKNPETGDRLYQLIVNLSPVGGKIE